MAVRLVFAIASLVREIRIGTTGSYFSTVVRTTFRLPSDDFWSRFKQTISYQSPVRSDLCRNLSMARHQEPSHAILDPAASGGRSHNV